MMRIILGAKFCGEKLKNITLSNFYNVSGWGNHDK
jgi:hypothetical protein